MTYIINESKRDDLLIPYYEKIKAQYPELTLGMFKGRMLDKLAAQGGINNLSLSSNYYLAGATKYYFNGDLTTNGKANFAGQDMWNESVCKRLNALIMILRDAYIDTIGTTFEQPEDFGELSIAKLLRKYGKKIDEALGLVTKKKVKETPSIDNNPNVGNGYTFDILYSYEDATKYSEYTRPGAWCITYGLGHYNGYIKRLGIHYVIFRKNGFENVQRPNMPVNKNKPHDEYGNSLIAVLQSNTSWEPVFITSRWNHGYGESSGTEADHAYTTEEFCRITGVSKDDLQRIYELWKANKGTKGGDRSKGIQEKKAFVHKLKYAQMRMNGGESAANFFECAQILNGKKWSEAEGSNVNIRKYVLAVRPKASYFGELNFNSLIIIDRGNIVFDALGYCTDYKRPKAYTGAIYFENGEENPRPQNLAIFNAVIMEAQNGYTIYDTRKKEVISIDGIKTFKYLPENWARASITNSNNVWMVIKMTAKTIALLDLRTNQPLRLPNGGYWFNRLSFPGMRGNSYRADTYCDFIIGEDCCFAEILYDESSGEKYYYSFKNHRWLTAPSFFDIFKGGKNAFFRRAENVDTNRLTLSVDEDFRNPNMAAVCFATKTENFWERNTTPYFLMNDNNQRMLFDNIGTFMQVRDHSKGLISFSSAENLPEDMIYPGPANELSTNRHGTLVYDSNINQVLKVDGKYIVSEGVWEYFSGKAYEFFGIIALRYFCRDENSEGHDFYYLYDINRHGFLINPLGFPSDLLFYVDSNSSWYSKAEYKSLTRNQWYNDNKDPDKMLFAVFKQFPYEYGYNDNYFNSEKRRRMLKLLRPKDLKLKPISMDSEGLRAIPLNSENNQPALQLRESDIRNMVVNAINEIYGQRK